MTDRYHFAFGGDTVYARVVEMVEQFHAGSGSTIVDVGCGFGAVAEPLQKLGFDYLGLDSNEHAVKDLKKRGFEAERVDLLDVEGTLKSLVERLADKQLGAMLLIDSLEHLTNGPELLHGLARFSVNAGGAPLVVSIPNVTHIDIGTKLLLGRWDVTETGLLDETHVNFFSDARLDAVARAAGWARIGAADFPLPESDQHFPDHCPALENGTPLREFLLGIRTEAGPAQIVNQFVRAYAPLPEMVAGSALETNALETVEGSPEDTARPFLTVLTRTKGTRPATLQETLLSLAAQTDQDFEVLILGHDMARHRLNEVRYLADGFGDEFSRRVRLVPVDGGGRSRPLNIGVALARGEYVAILDDDDVVFAHWVQTFKALAARAPGRVLRSVPAEQDVRRTTWAGVRPGYEIQSRPRCPWALNFDVLTHLFDNQSPPCCYALPRSAFSDLGIRFDESLPVLEDWDVLIRIALLAGVEDTLEVTSLWRKWMVGGDSSLHVHSVKEWERARSAVEAKLDGKPVLLPRRSLSAIHDMSERVRDLQSEVAKLEDADRRAQDADRRAQDSMNMLEEMRHSSSWKLSAPLRVAGRLGRRISSRLSPH